MKKILLITILATLAGLFLLTACTPADSAVVDYGSNYTPLENDDLGELDEPSENNYTVELLFTSIAPLEDARLDTTQLYIHEVNYNDAFTQLRDFRFDGEGVDLLFWVNQPIFNLSLIAIEHDDYNRFFVTDSVFTLDKLDASHAEALLIRSYYGIGTLPWSGITFENEHGYPLYLTLMQSGFDGLFHLDDFAPAVFDPAVVVESNQTQAAKPGLVWAVEPTLAHESLSMCLNGIIDADRNLIDPQTGLLSGTFCDGHGGPGPHFVFDPLSGLFGHPGYGDGYHTLLGMHPRHEFFEMLDDWAFEWSRGLMTIQSVDSTIYEEWGDGIWGGWWLTEDAFLGQFALMYDHMFVTDFIFDGGAQRWHNPAQPYIAVSVDGKWGLVGHDGSVVLDFMFDNIVIVDEDRAFAKYGGFYGILDIQATIIAN